MSGPATGPAIGPATGPAPRWAFGRARFGGADTAVRLAAPLRVADVFTPAEVRYGTGRPQRYAGRLAAKRAVLRLLGLPFEAPDPAGVEIRTVPPALCRANSRCAGGHPPVLRLSGTPALRARSLGLDQIQISISHAGGTAVAVALGTPAGTGAGRTERSGT